jgi:hypothetical protein
MKQKNNQQSTLSNIIEFDDDEIKRIQNLNPKKEALTIDKLKTFAGCENLSNNEAAEAVKTIHQIALVMYEFTQKNKMFSIDNQLVVNLKNKNKEQQQTSINSQQKLIAI